MRILLSGILLSFCLLPSAFADRLDDARVLLDKGKHSRAMSKVNEYIKAQPNDPNGRFLKGFVLQRMGDIKGATKIYASLAKDFPALPEPHNNLAAIYAGKGDYESAKSSLLSALKTHPGYSKVYTNLSEIYAKEASEVYQKALGVDKRRANASVIHIPSFSKLSLPESNQVAAAVITKPPVVAVVKPAKPSISVAAVKTKSAALLVSDEDEKIKSTISDWAVAWSSQNAEDYLSYYASFFKPKSGSLAEWKQQRRQRLEKPEYISISLENMTLKPFAEGRVRVDVVQHYQSDTYNDVSKKRFFLNRNTMGEWKIYREKSI